MKKLLQKDTYVHDKNKNLKLIIIDDVITTHKKKNIKYWISNYNGFFATNKSNIKL